MTESRTETITPDIAMEILKKNPANRIVSKDTVESYARDIKRGKFVTTHQGIAIATDGTLLDGQHRLLAVALTGIPIQIKVTRDCDREIAEYIDRGRSRSVKDVMSIRAKQSSSPYDIMLSNQKLISALSQLARCSLEGRLRTSVSDVRSLMDEFESAAKAVYNLLLSKSHMSARAPVFAASIAAITCGVDPDAVSKFFQIVYCDDVTGCDNYNVNAALNFKRQVEQAKAQRIQTDRKKLFRCTQNAIYHFVNNTGVTKILAPAECRYDVSEKVERALAAN